MGRGLGNAALVGRELPPAQVLAADERVSWWAQLRQAGLDGSMDELRARPTSTCSSAWIRPARQAGDGSATDDTRLERDSADDSGTRGPGAGSDGPDGDGPDSDFADGDGPDGEGPDGEGPDDGGPDRTSRMVTARTAADRAMAVPARGASGTWRTGRGRGPAGFVGRINLTVPLATMLGLAGRPGEAAGIGPVDPALARDLARAAAATRRPPGA